MRERPSTMTDPQAAARRQGVRRTVLLFVIIVVVIYAGFIVSGLHR